MSITKQVTLTLEVLLTLEDWARLDIQPRGMGEHRVVLAVIGNNEAETQERLQKVQAELGKALQSGGVPAVDPRELPQELRHQPEEFA